MASPSTKAPLIAGAVLTASAGVAADFGQASLALAFGAAAAAAVVAFAAQLSRFGGDERLVYRPVYARRRNVPRRPASDD